MIRLMLCSVLMTTLVLADEKKAEGEGLPKADIRGQVENVVGVKARGAMGTMLIKGAKDKDTAYDQASVRVTTTTKVARWQGGKKVPAKFGDIKKGDRVQATFVGPVAESFPVQASAGEVLILDAPKEK